MILAQAHGIVKAFKVAECRTGFRAAWRRSSTGAAARSTTVKILTGVLTPDQGDGVVDGIVPYKSRQELAKRIGVFFGQRTRLWWVLPVRESLEHIPAPYSIPQEHDERNLSYLRKVLSLGDLMDKPVRTLSLGQRMRVDIAAAMLHDPKPLYLNEFTVGLDVVEEDELQALIQKLNRDRSITVLLRQQTEQNISRSIYSGDISIAISRPVALPRILLPDATSGTVLALVT